MSLFARILLLILNRHDAGLSQPVPKPTVGPARVLDLEAAGARVKYTTERTHDEKKARASRQRADERERLARKVADGTIAPQALIRRVK